MKFSLICIIQILINILNIVLKGFKGYEIKFFCRREDIVFYYCFCRLSVPFKRYHDINKQLNKEITTSNTMITL